MADIIIDDRPPPPAPITVKQAIDELQVTLNQIRRKLRTLIDWYIFPDVVPNSIKAYDPRLQILQARLRTLSTIDYNQLPYIIDGSDATAANYLNEIVEQMQNSARGIQTIFFEHYDRDLLDRRPFAMIWETLMYRQEQIRQFHALNPSNPSRRMPEDLRPQELGNFCRGALGISNRRDRGTISFVEKRELNEENRRKLKAFGGAYLNWQCPECAYKVRYHVTGSTTSNIHTTDEIRGHVDLPIQYRSSWLAKCHLYVPQSEKTSFSSNASRRESYAPLKYGCVFCFAKGYELERRETAFTTIREFAQHIAHEHVNPLPPSLLIHRYSVAVDGKTVTLGRWDLNLL
ncbi:hypothetical protein H2200_008069 [Cladophialophora chaetospira]|uniref:Uncharacterized protein n=1 Tax=Cladophialophora chaetospira TaxID=386627 RepID=A0AA39CH85_9EURO|nr:hypothetical protein H2200_008069 [Cladophialophora chaetospira]